MQALGKLTNIFKSTEQKLEDGVKYGINSVSSATNKVTGAVSNAVNRVESMIPGQQGGKAKKTGKKTKAHKEHNGKSYVVRTGAKGGRYILVKGKKVYI